LDAGSDTTLDPRLLLTTLGEERCAVPAHVAQRLGMDEGHTRAALEGLERGGFVRRDAEGAFQLPAESLNELRELYVVAILLEGLAVRSSAPFGDDTLEELRACNERLRAAAGETRDAIIADDDFHRTLVRHCGNERLLKTHTQTKAALLRYERYAMIDPERVRRSADLHDEIVAALEAGDHPAAAGLVRRNFEDSLPDLERGLGS
jgi:DNA-binding GntR family transcriptional regulator